MVAIEWNDSFSVGIPEIDQQHANLVNIFNIFIEQYEKKGSSALLIEILQKIIQDFLYHVAFEENFFKREGIQISPDHHNEHQQTIIELKLLQEQMIDETLKVDEKLINYLVNLIHNHLSDLDQKDFLRLKK